MTHGKPQTIGPALARLATVAREAGVELRMGEEEAEKHGLTPEDGNGTDIDIAVVLGGDGTMLRALNSLPRHRGAGHRRQLRPSRLSLLDPTRRARSGAGARLRRRVPRSRSFRSSRSKSGTSGASLSTTSSSRAPSAGRMIQLEWAVGGETLGRLGCDGVVCCDTSGLDRLQLLQRRSGARLGSRRDVRHLRRAALAERASTRGAARLRADHLEPHPGCRGHRARRRPPVGDLPPGGRAVARVGAQRSLLATLPEVTFFSRYRRAFAS